MNLTKQQIMSVFTEDAVFYTGNGDEQVRAYALTNEGFWAQCVQDYEGNPVYNGDRFHYKWDELSLNWEDIILPEEDELIDYINLVLEEEADCPNPREIAEELYSVCSSYNLPLDGDTLLLMRKEKEWQWEQEQREAAEDALYERWKENRLMQE